MPLPSTFSLFGDQGDCVRFVQRQALQACLTERNTSGRTAFAKKYGIGRDHVLARWRCITLATG
jgi:hypothetical protein